MRATEQLTSVRSLKKEQIQAYFRNLQRSDSSNIISLSEIHFEEIDRIMLDTNQVNGLGNSGEVYLVDSDFIMKSKSRFLPYEVNPVKVKTNAVMRALSDGCGTMITADYRGVTCLSSFDRLSVNGLNWVIVAEIDYDEALIPIKNLRNDMIFVSVIILILIFSIAQIIRSDIVFPVQKLIKIAGKIGEGDYNSKVDIRSENEFGLLALTFNQMIESIQINTLELVDEKAKRISALYDGQEFERHRISRELHDGLAQELIAIKMTLENLISKKEFANYEKINELKAQINHSIDELRKISTDLAPSGILEFGFEIAIKNLCSQVQRSSGIKIDFSWFGYFGSIKQRTKIYLYRIVQEALNNAIKHSEATQILVQLTETTENLVLIIEDNGKGFNYNINDSGLGRGVFNMRERSILLEGTFDVETSPENGTTIRVKVNKIV